MATTKPLLHVLFVLITACLPVVFGCGREAVEEPTRVPMKIQELVLRIDAQERTYFFSDRRGGLLVGTITPGSAKGRSGWSVDGTPVAEIAAGGLNGGAPGLRTDSALIDPTRVAIFRNDGSLLEIEPLELPLDGVWGLGLSLHGAGAAGSSVGLLPARDFVREPGGERGFSRWTRKGSGYSLCLSAGEGAEIGEGGLLFRGGGRGEGGLRLRGPCHTA